MPHSLPHRPRSNSAALSMTLLDRARSGDADALDRLVSANYDRLRGMVRKAMGPRLRSVEESVDLVQETLVTATRKLADFEPRTSASFFNWLSKIAQRKVLHRAKFWRASKRAGHDELRLDATRAPEDSCGFEPASGVTQPDVGAARAEQAAIVRECVQEVDSTNRCIVLLREEAQRSWESIASLTGRPNAHAARMAHTRAMEKLAVVVRKRLNATG